MNPTADVSVVKLGPTSVTAGEQVEFVLVLSNSGPSDAVNVVLEDIMPSYIHDAQFSTDNGNSWNVWENRFEAGTLAPGSLVTVLIRGTVAASAVGIIENTARISSDTEDPDPSNNDSAITVDVTTSADIQITKAGSPKPVETGGELVYQITVNNAGPSDAQEVVVTDSIPSSLENVQYSLDYGNIWRAWNGSYTFTSIAAGTKESLLIRGTVSRTASGVIENTVRADSATPDPDDGNNFAVDETGIHTMADLTITKSGAPVPAVRGETLVYTLTVTNLGPDMAENIVLTDDMPGDLEQPQFSTDGGNTWADWTSTYTIDTDLLPGETITVLIRGTVTQTSGPMIENTANVSSTTPDPDLSNNTVQEKTPVGQAADLSVLKTFESNRAVPGEQVIYNLAVSNSGPDSAQDVVLMDTLQQILKEPEFSLDGGTTWQPWPGSYNIGTLNVNATVNVRIRGYIPASHEGILINTASVESLTEDPVEDNNTSKVEMDVTPLADLELTKTVDNSSPLPGSDVIFTIHITNHGPSDAKDVVLIDPVSVQLLQVMYSTDGVNYMPWSSPHAIGNIPANETASVWIRGTVSPSATGRIANTADAESRTEDPNADNNQDTVIIEVSESADLSVAKLAVPRPVEPGAMITYTVIISNAGPAAARSVQMADELPNNITGGEYSVDLGKSWSSWNGTYSAGDLEAGSEVVVLIRGKVSSDAQGILSNTATVESTTNDPDLDNNHFTVITEINAAADLSITKAASPVPALNGKFLTYTLTAKNAGPSEAKNVVISDRVSDAEYSLDDGKTWEQWNGFYDAGTLAAGAQLRLQIRKIVNVQENGLISNTALITSTTPDPNPENNRFTIQTPAYAFSELFITKRAYPECAVACRELIYCITVSNRSSVEAERTILTDYVPRQLCHVKYSSDGGATWKPWNGTYHLGSLPAASTVQILISGFVESCACGRIVNTAAVSSLLPGSNPLDRVATVETRIRRR